MGVYNKNKNPSLAGTSVDDSLASSYFKDVSTIDSSKSDSLGTFEYENDTFSVQTPSVNASVNESVASYSMDSAPSIRSVQTPSVQENDDIDDDMMDQSTFGSVIESVIHSIVGKKNKPATNRGKQYPAVIVEEEDGPGSEMDVGVEDSQVVEEEYDHFMNDFSEQSVDIMRKRSVGLIQVMSTLDQGEFGEESDDDNDDQEPFTTSENKEKHIAEVMKPDQFVLEEDFKKSMAITAPPIKTSLSKSSRRSRSSNKSKSRATGMKGLGRRKMRAASPSAKSMGDDSTIDVETSSIGFSVDSSQPSIKFKPNRNSKNKFSKGGSGNVTKGDLELRREIEILLTVKKYEEMLDTIRENPKILAIQVSQPSGKTFLHIIASMANPPPETVILKVVSMDTSLVAVTDNNNNTPLHFAAQNVRKGNMHAFMVLLKFHPMGASERNSDGDLPLHIVTSHPVRGAEEAAHLLLETHPKAITAPNNKGKIPLHLALSEGSKNLKLLLKLLKLHKFRKSDVDVLDNKGEMNYYRCPHQSTISPSSQRFVRPRHIFL